MIFLQSAITNIEGFTKREVTSAINTRDAQAKMGFISEGGLKAKVSRKVLVLASSDTSHADIANAKIIHGPTHQCIRGKSTRGKLSRIKPDYLSLPSNIVDRCKYLSLVGNVMFVCGLLLFDSFETGMVYDIAI